MTDLAEPALAPAIRRATPYWFRDAPTALTRAPQRRSELHELLQQVSSLITLTQGWDDEGAAAVEASAVRRAYDFLSHLSVDWLPWVAPTTDGGVRVEWDADESFLMIQFEPDDHAEVHFRLGTGPATSMRDGEIPDDLGPVFEVVRRARS